MRILLVLLCLGLALGCTAGVSSDPLAKKLSLPVIGAAKEEPPPTLKLGPPEAQSFAVQVAPEVYYYYLTEWEWWTADKDMDYWRCPGGTCVGLVDLRSLPQMSLEGGVPQGYGFFAYPTFEFLPGVYLGNDTEGLMNTKAVEIALSVTIPASVTTPPALLFELMTNHADPTGATKWKPLRGSLAGGVKLIIGNQIILRPFDVTTLDNTVAVFQADYRRNKADGIPLDTLRKWTGLTTQKLYGKLDDDNVAKLLPPEYVDDGWQKPTTVITDDFNRGDNDLLGASSEGWSWVEDNGDWDIVSNQAKAMAGSTNIASANINLSGDDHYSQAILITPAGLTAAVVRFADVNNFYMGGYRVANQWQAYKRITGSFTQLGADLSANGAPASTFYAEVNASTIDTLRDGVSQGTRTDSALTGQLQTGVYCGGQFAVIDDYEAGDLGTVSRRYIPAH